MISRIIKVEVRVIRQSPRLQGVQIEKTVAGGNCKKNETENENETEKLSHLFWTCPKTQVFWTNFKVWLQSCQVIAKETPLEPVI